MPEDTKKGLSTPTVVLLIVVVLAVAAIVIMWLITPPPQPPRITCIEMPELSESSQRKPAFEMATKLESVEIDANMKAQYQEMTKKTFQELGDKEVAFLLVIRAIDCYMTKADTPEKEQMVREISPQLIQLARDMWASSHELKGSEGELSVKEVDILEKSKYGNDIFTILQENNIQFQR